MNVWVAADQAFPGDNWAALVAQGLETSDAMIVLLMTPTSVHDTYLANTLSYAFGHQRFQGRIVSVVNDQLPETQIPWVLKGFQMIKLSGQPYTMEMLGSLVQQVQYALLAQAA